MNQTVIKPHKDSNAGKREQVEKMFDDISGNYDVLNRVITFGMDKGWRKNVLNIIKSKSPKSILDIATGTGDMAILLSETNSESIVGIDISQGMLDIAKKKISERNLQNQIKVQVEDSESMSFDGNSFDAATVIYGIRNFENLKKGLKEINRVLKPGGTFVILETSVPENKLIKSGYLFYTKYIMPSVARLISKDKNAYKYLSESALNFPYGKKLKEILEESGFKNIEIKPQFFGVSTIYKAEK